MCSTKKNGKGELSILTSLMLIPHILCALQPYYLNFPPPVLTVPNAITDFPYSSWSSKPNETLTRGGNLPSGPIPLVLHTWLKPDNTEGTKLQNGTVIYYLGGPWGGIRTSPPTATENPQSHVSPVSNSLTDTSGGWGASTIDITTPPPSRQQTGPWGHGHFGFGWPSSTQLYDKIPETTSAPIRSQLLNVTDTNTTVRTTTSKDETTIDSMDSSTARSGSTTTVGTTTTPFDPVSESVNSRYPVSDSVRKFRRIIAQIRSITKKELGTESREARREQRRRERLRNRANTY